MVTDHVGDGILWWVQLVIATDWVTEPWLGVTESFMVLAWRLPIMLRNVQSSHPNWCIIIREGCLLWSDLNEKFNLGSRGVEFWKVIGYNATFPRSWRFWLVRLTSSDHLPVWSGNHLLLLSTSTERAPAITWQSISRILKVLIGPFHYFQTLRKGLQPRLGMPKELSVIQISNS